VGQVQAALLAPCRCGHPGLGCTCFLERRAELLRNGPPVETGKRPTPKWVKHAFVISMVLNPATWITVAWKLYREGRPPPRG
jgi:hypothetical protein